MVWLVVMLSVRVAVLRLVGCFLHNDCRDSCVLIFGLVAGGLADTEIE